MKGACLSLLCGLGRGLPGGWRRGLTDAAKDAGLRLGRGGPGAVAPVPGLGGSAGAQEPH